MDEANGLLPNDTLTLFCEVSQMFSRIEHLPFKTVFKVNLFMHCQYEVKICSSEGIFLMRGQNEGLRECTSNTKSATYYSVYIIGNNYTLYCAVIETHCIITTCIIKKCKKF